MKRYIKSSMERPYLYIFKHGIGPGTLPSDVTVVKIKDLPRGYTAVWTDRFLTTSEMDQYDIPYETEINRYLDRIGYCQKNGDVVPCDDVGVCSTSIKSSKYPRKRIKSNRAVKATDVVKLGTAEDNLVIDMWFENKFEPMKYGADAYFDDREATYWGWIYDDSGKMVGSYTATDSTLIPKNFKMTWAGNKIAASRNVTAATMPNDDQVKFFYKGEFLGSCDPEYMECDKLYELLESDTRAATQVLNYMNSLGDPVFPTKDGGYEAETDVSKVDIHELYNLFMQELYYSYQDFPEDFYVGGDYLLPDFEIFTGAVAEDVEI